MRLGETGWTPQTWKIVGLKLSLFEFDLVWTWPETRDLLCSRLDIDDVLKTAFKMHSVEPNIYRVRGLNYAFHNVICDLEKTRPA